MNPTIEALLRERLGQFNEYQADRFSEAPPSMRPLYPPVVNLEDVVPGATRPYTQLPKAAPVNQAGTLPPVQTPPMGQPETPVQGNTLQPEYIDWLKNQDKIKDSTRTNLQNWRDIAEGFGNMTAVTPGEIRRGLKPQPYVAEGIRDEQDRLEDQMTDADRAQMSAAIGDSLGSSSFKIPKGMTWSRLEKFFPHMTGSNNPLAWRRLELQAEQERGRNQRFGVSAGLRERGLDQGGERIDIAKGNQDIARTRMGQIPEGGMTPLRGYMTGIQALQRVRNQFNEIRDEWAGGPVSGRIESAMLRLGAGDEEMAKLNASTVDALAQYVRSLSGAQVHVSEFERLKTTYPGIAQSPEQFEALLTNMEEILEDRLGREIALQKANRRNTEGIKEAVMGKSSVDDQAPKQQTAPSSTSTGQMKTMKSPKGSVRTVTEEEAAILREMGWSE